jgi:hypothetical protein
VLDAPNPYGNIPGSRRKALSRSVIDLSKLEARLAPLNPRDVDRMFSRFHAEFVDETSFLRDAGLSTFDRIADSRWSVEWNLSRWLAEAARIPESRLQHLVAANVLGLAYVRLVDDRLDGESPVLDPGTSRRLEATFFGAAQREYRQLLGTSVWFWERFTHYHSVWQLAVRNARSRPFYLVAEDPASGGLVDPGAPLLISCAAVCELCGDRSLLKALEAPVRHYLAAAVLYDHLKDWKADATANRPNAFIQWMLRINEPDLPGSPSLADILVSFADVKRVEAYIAVLLIQLDAAIQLAQAAGLRGFSQHLMALALEAKESAALMLERIEGMLAEAHEMLLPPISK